MINLQEWKRKRVTTTRAFLLECVMLGMEYSLTFLTLWLYLNTLVETDNVKFYYSIISASYLLAAVVFSVLIGRWVDETRSIRKIFFICNTLVIIGNLLYIFHYSPLFLVVGRLICGAGSPLRCVISGEIARCYPSDEVMNRFSANGMAFAFGFILGPGVNFIFKEIEFTVGSLHVNYTNMPGIYMSVFFLVTQIYIFINLHDLSKGYDLKAEQAANSHHKNPDNLSVHLSGHHSLKNDQSLKSEKSFLLKKERRNTFSHIPVNSMTDHANCLVDSVRISTHSLPASIKQDIEQSKQDGSGSTHTMHTSLAVAKIEQSGLFSQTFTRSDSMMSTSVLILLRSHRFNEERTPLLDNESYDGVDMGFPQLICHVVSHFDTLFILALTYWMWYWMVSFEMWLPIMVVDVLGFGITELNAILFGFGCISAIILSLLSVNGFSDSSLFILSLFCTVSLALMELIFTAIKWLQGNLYLSVVFWVVWGTLFAIVVVMDEVFLIGVLAKMTSSKFQTFNESLRLVMARLGAFSALLTSVYLFKWLEYACLAGVCFAALAFFILLLRRRTFSTPKIVIK